MWQDDRARAALQIVNVDDLRVRVLNVRHGETNRLHWFGRPEEARNRYGKCNRHLEFDRRRNVVSLGCIYKSAGQTRSLQ